MSVFPFSEKGVEDKLEALYALTDPDLAVEADAIETDFTNWMKANFSLDTQQTAYLDTINMQAIRYYGSQCALCFRHRLDIQLIYPAPPSAPGYSKWLDVTDTIVIGVDGTGNLEVNGSLTFTIAYKL